MVYSALEGIKKKKDSFPNTILILLNDICLDCERAAACLGHSLLLPVELHVLSSTKKTPSPANFINREPIELFLAFCDMGEKCGPFHCHTDHGRLSSFMAPWGGVLGGNRAPQDHM